MANSKIKKNLTKQLKIGKNETLFPSPKIESVVFFHPTNDHGHFRGKKTIMCQQ